MGCDIHIALERKNTNTGEWVGVQWLGYLTPSALSLSYYSLPEGEEPPKQRPDFVSFTLKQRDYEFFNELCGVRGEGSSFGYAPRGLPEDASSMSRLSLGEDDPDLHSHSWLSIRELLPVLAKCKSDEPIEQHIMRRMANELADLPLAQKWLDDSIEEHNVDEWRLVFAFDN